VPETDMDFPVHIAAADAVSAIGFSVDSISNEHVGRMQMIRKFLANESGATAIEYALIAAGIALAIIASVNSLGSKISNKFSSINSSLK
jgi:pilus assembly protein Flp/PilA